MLFFHRLLIRLWRNCPAESRRILRLPSFGGFVFIFCLYDSCRHFALTWCWKVAAETSKQDFLAPFYFFFPPLLSFPFSFFFWAKTGWEICSIYCYLFILKIWPLSLPDFAQVALLGLCWDCLGTVLGKGIKLLLDYLLRGASHHSSSRFLPLAAGLTH